MLDAPWEPLESDSAAEQRRHGMRMVAGKGYDVLTFKPESADENSRA